MFLKVKKIKEGKDFPESRRCTVPMLRFHFCLLDSGKERAKLTPKGQNGVSGTAGEGARVANGCNGSGKRLPGASRQRP